MPIGIDNDVPIVPDEGLGGLQLRVPLWEYEELIVSEYVKNLPNTSWYSLSHPFEARYRFDSIELGVDVRSGKLYRISALDGYRGELFDMVRVGMLVGEAMQLDGRIYYDEAEELLLVRDVPGVSLDVLIVDPPPDKVPNLRISAISVVAEDLVWGLMSRTRS